MKMTRICRNWIWAGLSAVALGALTSNTLGAAWNTIRLHPENPHYFLWRGKPTILITSAEHYGALINLDFNYKKYLDTLAKDKLNLTRVFTGGAYVEPQGSFNIALNTLAPGPGRFISPWKRSGKEGYAGGGNKFDLFKWDEEYFARLRDFVAHAGDRGVVVEVNLFCPMYEEAQWKLSPFNEINNVNGVGNIARNDLLTLKRSGGLLPFQERLVRRIVDELRDFDNIYYEVCNEPYAGNVPKDWEHHIVNVIVEAQKDHPYPKLISQNIANGAKVIEEAHPRVSIFNFHYAQPPVAVDMNYHLNRVIGDNETGFRGTNDAPYRMEGWDFIMAGGALYNNLDYSFAIDHEGGTFVYPATQPGGGNANLRRQLRVLRDFIYGFNFVNMRPDQSVVVGGLPESMTARVLSEPGQAYAMYLRPYVVTQFSARWTGKIEPATSQTYSLHAVSNDGVRIWVDGRPVIDDWTDRSEKERAGTVALEAGRKHDIRVEYFYNGGAAAMKLLWSAADQERSPVPSEALCLADGSARGLRGEYFFGKDLAQPWKTRVDSQVNFAWGTDSPFPVPTAGETITLTVNLPAGRYSVEWVDPTSGKIIARERIVSRGERLALSPVSAPVEDIALRINRR